MLIVLNPFCIYLVVCKGQTIIASHTTRTRVFPEYPTVSVQTFYLLPVVDTVTTNVKPGNHFNSINVYYVKMRTPIPTHYKQAVLRRQKNKCRVCCNVLDVYDIDHIVPYRICREHKLSNLQALCPTCHARKTRSEARYLAEYVRCEQTPSYRLCWGCKKVVSAYFGFGNGCCSACSFPVSSLSRLSLF
jgi:5-methylcytosine-specific restriction endonuclease McrA